MNNFKIHSEVLKQYKDLTCKEEKLFYYAYGKFYLKIRAIMKQNDIDKVEELDWGGMIDYTANVDYDEIKILNGIKRVDKNNFRNVENHLIKDSNYIKIFDEDYNIKVLFLYKEIYFDNSNRKIRVTFDENIKLILKYSSDKNYTNVLIDDLNNIKKNYDLKLYLYALTIYREKNSKGIIRIKLDELRNILNPESMIKDNNFYSRFINGPCKNINNNKNLSMKVNCKRDKDLITLSIVKRKKEGDINDN